MVNVMATRAISFPLGRTSLAPLLQQLLGPNQRNCAVQNPWCRLVKPYLGQNEILPEGQLDFPCAKGVADAQDNAVAALEQLITEVGAP